MSEQQLKDFAETAERRVSVPDLVGLTSRGRDLRRVRLTGAGILAALVLVTGGLVASIASHERAAPAPDPAPPPRLEAQELPVRSKGALVDLRPGRSYLVRPWTAVGDDRVRASFTGPAGGWVWRDDVAFRSVSGKLPSALPRAKYAGVGVMVADRVSAISCSGTSAAWTLLSDAPVRAAQQIAAAPGVRLVEPVRADTRFGHAGAHVRIEVPRLCPGYEDVLLWGLTELVEEESPGLATVFYPGQQLDVWVVEVNGTTVVVWSELSPDLPEAYGAQAQELVDSIRLDPARE